MEAGKLELDEEPFALNQLLDEVIALMRTQTDKKRLRLLETRGEDVSQHYVGDSLRIRQVLLNLLSNAIKFTEKGTVEVRVRRKETRGDRHTLEFEIEDSGIGIADDKLDQIFRPFEQEQAGTTKRFGGTGLGLSICKMLAEKMGGTATVRSEVGKGSVFGFTAVLAPSEASAAKTVDNMVVEDAPVRQFHVLVAEDSVINQKVAIGLLKKRGHKVELVENGQDALDAIEQNEFDAVLMDIEMPVMDGLTAVQTLRERERDSERHQWVVATTGHAMTGDKERFLAAGMDAHLVKPFKPAALYAAVERQANNVPSTQSEAPSK